MTLVPAKTNMVLAAHLTAAILAVVTPAWLDLQSQDRHLTFLATPWSLMWTAALAVRGRVLLGTAMTHVGSVQRSQVLQGGAGMAHDQWGSAGTNSGPWGSV